MEWMAMDLKHAFAELGLSLLASPADAKAAYRTLAMQWHPDINASLQAVARMKLINVAYAVVCHHLDLLQSLPALSAKPQVSARANHLESGFSEYDWKQGFKASPNGLGSSCAVLVQRNVQVSLFEAAFGCVKRVSGMEPATCVRCAGSGDFAGTWTLGSKCLQCFGLGKQGPGGGVDSVGRALACVACHGTGVFKPPPPKCPLCRGTGKAERKAWMVDLRIHAGTLDGSEVPVSDIRLRSSLNESSKKFKLTLKIEKTPIFRLDHDRLSVIVPVSMLRWALGGEMTVPTLDGSIRVRLPDRLTGLWVKDQGWPQFGKANQRKPLFVLPKMVFPVSLNDEERHMLQKLDARCKSPEVEAWNRSMKAWLESAA
jgi:molecular chaperone DnaJ